MKIRWGATRARMSGAPFQLRGSNLRSRARRDMRDYRDFPRMSPGGAPFDASRGSCGLLIYRPCLINRPESRRGQFQEVPIRIAEIDAFASAGPFCATLDRNAVRRKPLFPIRKLVRR